MWCIVSNMSTFKLKPNFKRLHNFRVYMYMYSQILQNYRTQKTVKIFLKFYNSYKIIFMTDI